MVEVKRIRSHRGNAFGRVSEMLHNLKYIGKYKYGEEVMKISLSR
ncbi:MAG: hypothetical protein ACLRSW_16675 [Christensenellaceae bacterium]